MENKKLKVLYIAGSGRSGSTILSNILGQLSGFYFAGEMCKIWRYGLIENRVCGCGKPLKECGFWIDIFNFAYDGFQNISGKHIYKLRQKSAFMRHIPLMMLTDGKKFFSNENVREFSGTLEKLYLAIQEKTRCNVIVDCSKTAPYGKILDKIEGIDMYIVHLIRDPRGVAFSKLEKRLYQPEIGKTVYTGQAGIVKSSLYWDIQNAAVEGFWGDTNRRYIRVKYEDFAASPTGTIQKIAEKVCGEKVEINFINDQKVMLEKKFHTAAGNPVRFNYGNVEIIHDVEWKLKLNRIRQYIVKLITLPYFTKYDYH